MYGEDCAEDCQERAECESTGWGHLMCGWCPEHDKPRHRCGNECIPWPKGDE